ncbi:MAG: TIGR03089 family protein [Actinomycetota bacterium]|nr:TIGR03089 family protein [Actinomycetota bacterium]
MSPITALLDRRVAADGAAPLITYYDDDTGERTELSAVTLANWVAKTANLWQDGLDVEPGQRVAVLLPPHWQTAAVLLGAWAVGATVTETLPASAVATDEGRLAEVLDEDGAPAVLGLSLHPLVARLPRPWPGVTDFADALLYGDEFVAYTPPDPAAVALEAGSLMLTAAGLVDAAAAFVTQLELSATDRLLVDVDLARDAGPVAWLLAPLAAGASIVLCRNADPAALPRRAESERVTVTLGLHVDGVRAAGG